MSMLNVYKSVERPLPPAWTTFIPEALYHHRAQTGSVLSSTMLKEFRRCPAQYRAITAGAAERKDSTAFRIGRAVHKLILEGDAVYRGAFAVGGPVNRTTGRSFKADSRTFLEWARDNGLDPARTLTPCEAREVSLMRQSVARHREAAELLGCGWAERSAEAEYGGLPCQARLDWLTPDNVMVDVKTTRDLAGFEYEARRYGYLHQFAFYRAVALAAGAEPLRVAAVVVEKREPHRVGVWHFPESVLAPYAAENLAALDALRTCRESGRWPTGFEAARVFPPVGLSAAWRN